MKHMNVIEKELGSREDYRATFIIITKIITSLQLTMTSSVSLIDKSSKSKSQVKAMASHVFNADDYLDLLLMVQLEDSIDKQWDLGETE
jgi:ATP-dependent Lon protease